MNIFYLDEDPQTAATYHCDKHVVKMILESAQMLSTAHRMLDGIPTKVVVSKNGKVCVQEKLLMERGDQERLLYKPTHAKHPSTVWTMDSSENYRWHYALFVALCEEYTYRYGKIHASETKLRSLLKDPPRNIPQGPLSPIRQAMPENLKLHHSNGVQAYRNYYKTKTFSMVWKNRETPFWF